MRNDPENKKKRGPIIAASVVIGFLGIVLAALIFPLITESMGILPAVFILLLYGGVIIAMIVGIIMALRQRLKEIESGEEEDAKQY